jgi:hypothetical protein
MNVIMKIKLLLLTMFLVTINIHAQFDKIIFQKSVNINSTQPNVYRLGDINKDGYDDILIYDCSEEKAKIFLGGNPMDTIPKYILSIPFSGFLNFKSAASLDVNGDGINDVLITTWINLGGSENTAPGDIMIFYGGKNFSTEPGLVFHPPAGATSNFGQMKILKDFNGDGKSELVIYDTNIPFETGAISGINYFYNTGPSFDTIPRYTIKGDSAKGIQVSPITSFGDINGDGKTDFTILVSDSIGENNKPFRTPRLYRNFYLGNSNFDFTPAVTYYQDSVGFDIRRMNIIKDMNGDGKDDFLASSYDNVFPYPHGSSILLGGFPIDTIQDAGLNTLNTYIDFIADAGDLNGDGYNDLFVKANDGTSNQDAFIWLGGRHIPHKIDNVADKAWFGNNMDTTQTNFGLCRQITAVGDVDGDKVDDICIQKIPYSSGDICIESMIYIYKGDTSAKGDNITSVGGRNKNIPAGYVLEEPYPNPFNPSTIISWQLANPGKVVIKLFDITGRAIAELFNKDQASGSHSIEINSDKYNLSSGVYFIQMQVSSNNNVIFAQSKKLLLVK